MSSERKSPGESESGQSQLTASSDEVGENETEAADTDQPSPETLVQIASMVGPLPPPKMLHQYDEVQEGLVERIVRMAERNDEHRRRMERRGMTLSFVSELIGQVFAFLVVAFMVGAGAYIVITTEATAQQVFGGLITLGGLAGLARVFVGGRAALKRSDDDAN